MPGVRANEEFNFHDAMAAKFEADAASEDVAQEDLVDFSDDQVCVVAYRVAMLPVPPVSRWSLACVGVPTAVLPA